MPELNDAADSGIDIDSTVAEIASGLGMQEQTPATEDAGEEPEVTEEATTEGVPAKGAVKATETPTPREMPKSWSKDKADMWAKLPPDAQEYYGTREKQFLDGIEQYKGDAGVGKQFREIITPYQANLAAEGVSPPEAVAYLLNAHHRLTQGTPQERQAAYRQLGEQLGFVQQTEKGAEVPPEVKELRDRLFSIESGLSQRQQAELKAVRERTDSEVQTFAADPANAYFNDVAQDMVPLVKSGLALKDAYERAVWGNPVTRQKELARLQTEQGKELKDRAKAEGEAALRTTGLNLRGAETRKAPTEPKGKFLSDQDMRETLRKIKERA